MADGRAGLTHERVHQILAHRFCGAEFPAFAQRAEQRAMRNLTLGEPTIEELFDPERDGHGANPSSLPLDVGSPVATEPERTLAAKAPVFNQIRSARPRKEGIQDVQTMNRPEGT